MSVRLSARAKIAALCLLPPMFIIPLSAASTPPDPTGLSALVPVMPTRIVDTRTGLGGHGKLHNDQTVTVKVTGDVAQSGNKTARLVPEAADAVVANITAVSPESDGYFTAWKSGTKRPGTSNVNFTAGNTVATGVTLPLSDSGSFDLFSRGASHLLVDITGYYRDGTLHDVHGVDMDATRLLDTRKTTPQAAEVSGKNEVTVNVGAENDVVVLAVTVAKPATNGYVTAWPSGGNKPQTSNLNYSIGDIVTNTVTLKAGQGGNVSLYRHTDVPMVIDRIMRIEAPPSPSQSAPLYDSLHLASPAKRLMDTRTGLGSDRKTGTRKISFLEQSPDVNALGSIILNVTAVNPSSDGFITVAPHVKDGTAQTSTVNYASGKNTSNEVIIPASFTGHLDVFSNTPTDIIVDFIGYTHSPAFTPVNAPTVSVTETTDRPLPVFNGPHVEVPENGGLALCGDPRAIKGTNQLYPQDSWTLTGNSVTLTDAKGEKTLRDLLVYDAHFCQPARVLPLHHLHTGEYTLEVGINVTHVDGSTHDGLYRTHLTVTDNPLPADTPRHIEPWGMRYLYDYDPHEDGLNVPSHVSAGRKVRATVAGHTVEITTSEHETFDQMLGEVAKAFNRHQGFVADRLFAGSGNGHAHFYVIDIDADQQRESPMLTELFVEGAPSVGVPQGDRARIGRPGTEPNTWQWVWKDGYTLPRANRLTPTVDTTNQITEPLEVWHSAFIDIAVPHDFEIHGAHAHFSTNSWGLDGASPRLVSDSVWEISIPTRSELLAAGAELNDHIVVTLVDGTDPKKIVSVPLIIL